MAAKKKSATTEELLKECREDFDYCRGYWSENYDEAAKDMDCVLCVPPPDFKKDREGRPCLWPDATSQYVNQTNNNLRQTKRAIKVSARSEDAKDVDAEHRQAYIQGIEYASKAQSIYSNAFESCVECGFGFWRVSLLVTGANGEQEPRIRRIANWATVFPDPDAQEADFSDSSLYFVTDTMRQSAFKRRYPKAQKTSFSGADAKEAPAWLDGDFITVAEWWKREEESESDEKKRAEDRSGIKHYDVTQRVTNGLEILETNQWLGSWIPIVGCFGLEKYRKISGNSKRIFLSLVRRARDSQQMLSYVVSQEAEEFGMAPRAPFQGYKGQFDPAKHRDLNREPMAYVEFNYPPDWEPSWGPPPLPTRPQFIPNVQAYEMAAEAWTRRIQASMGIMPLPTAAQRQNEKSGIALTKIQSQESIGSFHFTDNFVRALTNTGIQLNELITKLAERDSLPAQLLGKDQKGEDKAIRVVPRPPERDEMLSGDDGGDPEARFADDEQHAVALAQWKMQYEPADSQHLPEADVFFAHRGEFEVAISDGPSDLSQRDEVSAFVDTLLATLPPLGLAPQLTQQIIAIAIRLKNIGIYGEEIAELLAPPDPQKIPPQARALVMQAQAQAQAAMAEVQQLKLEKLGKVTETQGKIAVERERRTTAMTEADKDRETKLAVAEVMTKAQSVSERMAAVEDLMKQFHDQAHELAMQLQQQGHEAALSAQAQAAAAQQNAAPTAQEQQPQMGAQ